MTELMTPSRIIGPPFESLALPAFWLPLEDNGNGSVNLVPLRALGSPTPTFTRASTAWTKLASGLWTQVGSGVPRSAYIGMNTAATAYGGYLAEGTRTQLVTPTASIRDMTDASWTKVTMTAAKTATGIDGVANSASTITATGALSTILQTLVAAASSRTYSCWMRRKTGSGTILIRQGATTLDVTSLINSLTYTLVQLNASVLNSAFGIQINTSGDALEIDFNQFETDSFANASTPIDVAGAARNADVLTYPFANNASASAGTCYAELSLSRNGVGPAGTAVVNFTGANAGMLYINAGAATTVMSGAYDGTSGVQKTGMSDLSTGVRKRASSWGSLGLRLTGDGLTPGTAAFDGSAGSDPIAIGNHENGLVAWFGAIKNVRIWTEQFPDTKLQSITA